MWEGGFVVSAEHENGVEAALMPRRILLYEESVGRRECSHVTS